MSEPFTTDLVKRAEAFAIAAHGNQLRKYTETPYWHHPAAVVALVQTVPHTPEMLAAAWLHDVVEDTPVTLNEIRANFGQDVAELVYYLTDASRPGDGNRATRKALDRQHIWRAPKAAKTVKLADMIDNARSIQAHDPKFAKVYMAEKLALLVGDSTMTGPLIGGDPVLYDTACNIVDEYYRQNPLK